MTTIISSMPVEALTSFPKPTLSLSIPIDPALCLSSSFSEDSPVSSHIEDVHDHLPPPAPFPWTWTCHRCTHTYRFSAALNRCLSCSHRFCRACVSEYDYDGWDEWSAYYHPAAPCTSAAAFSPSTTASTSSASEGSAGFYANSTVSNVNLDLCCDPTVAEPCSSACTTPSLSPTNSSDSSSDEETDDDECISPSEHAWFSKKSAEIERHFTPSVADDERLLMGYSPFEDSWGMEMGMDLSGCGDERPLRVNHDDEEDVGATLWKQKPLISAIVSLATEAADEEETEDDDEEDQGLWMSSSTSPPRSSCPTTPAPTTTTNSLGVPKRSIILPAWNPNPTPTRDTSDRTEDPSRLGYRTKQEADAVEGELKKILERICEERGRYEEGMRSSSRSRTSGGSLRGGLVRRV